MSEKNEQTLKGSAMELGTSLLVVMLVALVVQYALASWLPIPYWRAVALVYVVRWALRNVGGRVS